MSSTSDTSSVDSKTVERLEQRARELERVLADYVVRFGMTSEARRILVQDQPSSSARSDLTSFGD